MPGSRHRFADWQQVEAAHHALARPWRFNELQKSIDGISQKALTEALRSMEADGISSAPLTRRFRPAWSIG